MIVKNWTPEQKEWLVVKGFVTHYKTASTHPTEDGQYYIAERDHKHIIITTLSKGTVLKTVQLKLLAGKDDLDTAMGSL